MQPPHAPTACSSASLATCPGSAPLERPAYRVASGQAPHRHSPPPARCGSPRVVGYRALYAVIGTRQSRDPPIAPIQCLGIRHPWHQPPTSAHDAAPELRRMPACVDCVPFIRSVPACGLLGVAMYSPAAHASGEPLRWGRRCAVWCPCCHRSGPRLEGRDLAASIMAAGPDAADTGEHRPLPPHRCRPPASKRWGRSVGARRGERCGPASFPSVMAGGGRSARPSGIPRSGPPSPCRCARFAGGLRPETMGCRLGSQFITGSDGPPRSALWSGAEA
jgi:hypothetical protein